MVTRDGSIAYSFSTLRHHVEHVLLAHLAVHRVAEGVGRHHEGVVAVDDVQVARLPRLIALGVVAAEHPAEHGQREPVHPVEPDHQRPRLPFARAVPRRNVQPELVQLAVEARAIAAGHRPAAVGLGVLPRRQPLGELLELLGFARLRLEVHVTGVDSLRQLGRQELEVVARVRGEGGPGLPQRAPARLAAGEGEVHRPGQLAGPGRAGVASAQLHREGRFALLDGRESFAGQRRQLDAHHRRGQVEGAGIDVEHRPAAGLELHPHVERRIQRRPLGEAHHHVRRVAEGADPALEGDDRHRRQEPACVALAGAGEREAGIVRRPPGVIEQAHVERPGAVSLVQDQRHRVLAGRKIQRHHVVVVTLGARLVALEDALAVDVQLHAIVDAEAEVVAPGRRRRGARPQRSRTRFPTDGRTPRFLAAFFTSRAPPSLLSSVQRAPLVRLPAGPAIAAARAASALGTGPARSQAPSSPAPSDVAVDPALAAAAATQINRPSPARACAPRP